MSDLLSLAPILAGPILRHTCPNELVVWLVCSSPAPLHLHCWDGNELLAQATFEAGHAGYVQLGTHAHLHLLQLKPEQPFPTDCWLSYDIGLKQDDGTNHWLRTTLPHVLYPDTQRPSFVIKSRVDQLLHGSCRKPHYAGDDGLRVVDHLLATARTHGADTDAQPALLMLTGDQVYVDDVAGPMLAAIDQVIARLGLDEEALDDVGADLVLEPESDTDLAGIAEPAAESANDRSSRRRGDRNGNRPPRRRQRRNYYRRPEMLPDTQANAPLRELFFGGVRKPVFTSANADNHLITLAEVIALYLLSWSPVLWEGIELEPDKIEELPEEAQQTYRAQLAPIRDFAAGLPEVQRALAQVPVYMIFDDHDITDDWNMTRAWENSAYRHPFSRRIIGNALIAYLLCQGWGNRPDKFSAELLDEIRDVFQKHNHREQDRLIQKLLKFENWHYSLATQPKLVVLDTRTRRWRSERGESYPSGLMDWEALTELQQELIHEKAVIMVSPAPIFGVKLIEVVQRVFTWFGYALTVDAENWMSHPGTASSILNIFTHRRTPHNFVILSGDVHYSFVYDVRLKHQEDSPHIWQITSSGIKNTFPANLLRTFDRLNRWLFASRSPLNWLTRRRHMRIRQRRPGEHSERYAHQRLLNACEIGRVYLDEAGAPTRIESICTQEGAIAFTEGYEHDWID